MNRTRAVAAARGLVRVLCVALVGACGPERRPPDATTADARGPDVTPPEASAPPCLDVDLDGVPDETEGEVGGANDNDGDGYTDDVEASGRYPSYGASSRPALVCGAARPDDCDMDGRPNHADLDSDNDGLIDAEELHNGTNPCREDTDDDGASDLVEQAARTDPRDRASGPPAGSLYVTLPYHPPGSSPAPATREFTFATRIRAADVVFVVDTTGSMGSTIDVVQRTLSDTIIPGIRAAIGPAGDIRYAVAGHGDFAEGGDNYTGNVTVFQRLDPSAALAQAATMLLRADNGGDYPESQVPALHALISGHGVPAYGGTATRMVDPPRDCRDEPDGPRSYGWACFRPGRVPILVLFSDADWHNGPGAANAYGSVPAAATYPQLVTELVRRGAYFIGIDVSDQGDTYRHSIALARATSTTDAAGRPVVFNGAAPDVARLIVNAVSTIASQSRQDIATRVVPDARETRLASPLTTASFVRAVVPVRGIPDAPAGYERHDATTFYSVLPSTQVVFRVEFLNQIRPGASTAELFQASIAVLGRADSEVDRRAVYIIVPAAGAEVPG